MCQVGERSDRQGSQKAAVLESSGSCNSTALKSAASASTEALESALKASLQGAKAGIGRGEQSALKVKKTPLITTMGEGLLIYGLVLWYLKENV